MKQATFFICAFLVLVQVYSGAYADDSDESTASATTETETETTTDSTSTASTDATSGSLAEYISEMVKIWADIQKLIQENNQSGLNEFVTEKIEFFEEVASKNNGTLLGTWAANIAEQLSEQLTSWNTAVDEQSSNYYNFLQKFASAINVFSE